MDPGRRFIQNGKSRGSEYVLVPIGHGHVLAASLSSLLESGGPTTRNWTPEGQRDQLFRSHQKKQMTERDWELYRLSVVEQMREGPYKDATIAAIRHKLQLLDSRNPQSTGWLRQPRVEG